MIVERYIDMNMAVNVRKCVYKLTYTYAWITQMEIQTPWQEEFRHMSKVMRTSIGTVTYLFIESVGKQEEKQKGG